MDRSIRHHHDELVDRCLTGESVAYEQLYKLYSKAMYNLCCRIVNDDADAEDVLQDAFVSAFKNLHTYKRDSTFGAWLKRIVINKAINFIKKKKIEVEPLSDTQELLSENEDDYSAEYDLVKIREAIDELPDGYRIVFSLYLLEGYDHSEIGQILGISESTSKSQYNRSKKKLREILNLYHGQRQA